MTDDQSEIGDEAVGFGKPPKEHQFRKGQSGNPKGRPKGAKGLKSILEKELNERVVINENGRKRTLSKLELTIKQLATKAAKGDSRATEKLLNYVMQLADPDSDRPAVVEPVSSEDAAILERALARRLRGRSDDDHAG